MLSVDGPTDLSVPGYKKPVRVGQIYLVAFPLTAPSQRDRADARASGPEEIVVATTRPETMYGDVAVAVHPLDERYMHLHGEEVIHPLTQKKLPIVLDDTLVDPSLGTGAVKITPGIDVCFASGLNVCLL